MKKISKLLDKQNKIMHNAFNSVDGFIKGYDIASIRTKLINFVNDHDLFCRDIITGNIKTVLMPENNNMVDLQDAYDLFKTFFCDKIKIISKKYNQTTEQYDLVYKKVSADELNTLWAQVMQNCTYSSRLEWYNNIPEWDGVDRIKSFMKDYFMCDTNPNFFLLFMTRVIGKIHDPVKNRCPFWFDFVGASKGTGKTTFFFHLLGKRAKIQEMKSRRDDFFVDLYNSNAVVAIDDECKWVGDKFNQISYDEFKALVTEDRDVFSRKFRQPEEHPRSFVIVRTSNHPKTTFSTNERRQIIFNIGLAERQCLHWQLDDTYMQQLLAEAKAYYECHGVYELSDEDWADVDAQNQDNYNTESVKFMRLENYVKYLRNADAKFCTPYDMVDRGKKASRPERQAQYYKWATWSDYFNWEKSQNTNDKDVLRSFEFWRQAEAMRGIHKWLFYDQQAEYRVGGTRVKMIAVAPEKMPDPLGALHGTDDDIGF